MVSSIHTSTQVSQFGQEKSLRQPKRLNQLLSHPQKAIVATHFAHAYWVSFEHVRIIEVPDE